MKVRWLGRTLRRHKGRTREEGRSVTFTLSRSLNDRPRLHERKVNSGRTRRGDSDTGKVVTGGSSRLSPGIVLLS